MTQYLSREELRELTGTPLRLRQISWLAREGWPYVVDVHGRVMVARAYHDRRLGIAVQDRSPEFEKTAPLNLDAL